MRLALGFVVLAVCLAACSAPPLAPCTTCGEVCVDLRADSRHCGDCNTACNAGSVCRDGACVANCSAGTNLCGTRCVDMTVDPTNCGACGTTCTSDQVCRSSLCQSVCPSGQELCGSACVTTSTDSANCGMCGRACPAGTACSSGTCQVMCQPNQTSCDGGACINSQTDNQNCGMCGRACPAGQVCSGGSCSTTCGGGLATCTPDGGSPSCADTQTDNQNCGMCGQACGAGQTCFSGTCTSFCAAGLSLCMGAGGAPFCTDVRADTAHCGACGQPCTGVCQGGICAPAAPTQLTGNVNLSVVNLGTRSCAQGGEMVRYSVTALTGTTATVSVAPAAGCLATNDEVLLISQQASAAFLSDGGPIANPNVGNWELVKVASVAGSTVTFRAAKTKFYGEGASDDVGVGTTQKVTLQRVPAFSTFEYSMPSDGGVLTADAWDGGSGGILALRATTAVKLTGTVDMRGKGFAGGVRVTSVASSGRQGDGPFGPGALDDRNASGAGGGGRGRSTGCFQAHGTAGGGAGHALGGFKSSQHCGGTGGAAMGDPALRKVFLGPGGGAGGTDTILTDNPPGGAGGRGGGIVMFFTPQLSSAVGIDITGTDGEGDFQGRNCPAMGTSTTDCWDYSGPGGGGAGGTFYLDGTFVTGMGTVYYRGGRGGDGTVTLAGIGGRGAIGRVLPLPQSCADVHSSNGDADYLLAFGGDVTKPYQAFCSGGRTYLTLPNRLLGGNNSYSRYDPTTFGPATNSVITTFWQRVRFDPATRRIIPTDYTFAPSQGQGTGGPFGGTVVTQWPYGQAGDCRGGGGGTPANVDLRGTPFAVSTNNVWVAEGFGPYGAAAFTHDRQVVNITGGGFCGGISPKTFPNGEIELTYVAPYASCQAIKTAKPTYTDGIYAVSPDPAIPSIPVYCDQTTSGGGWTLLEGNGAAVQMSTYVEAVPSFPGTAGFLPMSVMRSISAGATQVHLRTAGAAATRSFTTVANSLPIVNLRNGNQLVQFGQFNLADFTGPFASTAGLNVTCANFQKGWPNVYHSCGNATGLHWLHDVSKWNNSQPANEALELYVR